MSTTRPNPIAKTTTAPIAVSHIRSGWRIIGHSTVSNASTPTITPTACPDGNDVDGADTNALAGRGRSAACLAISVISPLSSTLITKNSAALRFRRVNATTMTTSATSRKAVGPNNAQNTNHDITQPGWSTP